MKTTTEQKEVVSNTVDTFTRMSEVAFSGIERLTALNLNMARESLQQGIAASMAVSRVQDAKDLENVQNPLSGAGAERVSAYVRGVQEIFSDAQSQFAELIGNHMSSFSMNGPVSFPGMEVFERIAQQTSDMTKANVRTATEATEKLVATAAQQVRKSA